MAMLSNNKIINFLEDDMEDTVEKKQHMKGFGFTDYPKQKLKKESKKMLQHRQRLPIFAVQSQLKSIIDNNDNIIIVGATGSGKTTQIPQFLYQWGYCKHTHQHIAITQPRRVAAVSIAERVSREFGTNLGDKIGYHVRFDKTISPNTQILYLTDGMLLRECMMDALLSKYSIIILDEAHERTLNTDILFGLIKSIQHKRTKMKKNSLKVVIMSATLQSDKFAAYFNNAAIFNVKGRMFDVDTLYLAKPEINYLDATLTAILQTHLQAPDGDILAFLTGKDEIDSMCDMLRSKAKMMGSDKLKLHILALYSSLAPHQQHLVFKCAPKGCRKIIVSTNLAETSVTIPNIKYVIDSGKVKRRIFSPVSGMDIFEIEDISKEESWQRTGRAGRTSGGYCLRLYTEKHFESNMPNHIEPDILRTNLCCMILQLKSIGIDDILSFDLLDKPDNARIVDGIGTLMMLGALDMNDETLTDLGRQMCIFPLDPVYSAVILCAHSKYKDILNDVLIIISMMSVDALQLSFNDNRGRQFENEYGDHLTLLNIFGCYVSNKCDAQWCRQNNLNSKSLKKAKRIYGQLLDLYEMHFGSLCVVNTGDNKYENICKCLLEAFFLNIAYYDENKKKYKTYSANNSALVDIHPSSVLFHRRPAPKLLLYSCMVRTKNMVWLKCCTHIANDEWIDAIIPSIKLLKRITTKQNKRDQNDTVASASDKSYQVKPGRAVKRMHTVFEGIQNGKLDFTKERKRHKQKQQHSMSAMMRYANLNQGQLRYTNRNNRNRKNNRNNRNKNKYRGNRRNTRYY
eukprot:114521_1